MKKIRDYINNSNVSRFRFIIQYWPSSYSYMVDISLYMFGQQLPTFACPYNAGSPGTCYLIAMQHGLHITWSELISYRGLAFLSDY